MNTLTLRQGQAGSAENSSISRAVASGSSSGGE